MICRICGKICITLDKNNICMQCHLDAKDAEISKLKARIEKLEEALKAYARKELWGSNYENDRCIFMDKNGFVVRAGWKIATRALEDKEE